MKSPEQITRIREYKATPEFQQHRREYDKKRWENPEIKAKIIEYRKSDKYKETVKKASKKFRTTEGYKIYRKNYRNSEKAKNARRNQLLLKNFGITLEIYDGMLTKQNGVCAICFRTDVGRALAVDHCHKTGKIRGLLCRYCNQALGILNDDIERISRAIVYLKG